MKGVLFLGLAGAALYMALDVSHDLLSADVAENSRFWQATNPTARPLRSWGTDLPALSIEASPTRSETAATRANGSAANQPSAPVASAALSPGSPAYDPAEWLSVRLAARVHGNPSVSSPTIRFYQPGTTLQVVSRENGWVQISDPASKESGWMLEQYLIPTDGPHATQTASATNAGALSELPEAKPARSTKKRARALRPTVRIPENVALEQFETRWERRGERRRGFGLFFGRFAGAE